MVKYTLQGINQQTVTFDAEPTDSASVLADQLVSSGKVVANMNIKLIFSGKIMDLNAPLESFGIKEGNKIIYMAAKKAEPVAQPVSSVPVPVAQPIPTPVPVAQPVPVINQLPQYFNGIPVEMIRQTALAAVLQTVISSPQIFKQILLATPPAQALRNTDPDGFDKLIDHPNFIPKEMLKFKTPGGANDGDFEDYGEFDDENDVSVTNIGGVNTANPVNKIKLDINQEETEFLKELHKNITATGAEMDFLELYQMFIACDKNKEVTLNMVYSQI